MRALAEIDKNFKVEKLGSAEYAFRDCREEPFRIYGLLMPTEETPHFMRMPQAVADQVNVQVQELACNTTGGRIRFKTDSAKVAIRVWMHDVLKAPHFPLTGSAGLSTIRILRKDIVPMSYWRIILLRSRRRSIKRWRKVERNSVMHLMRSSSVPPTLMFFAARLKLMQCARRWQMRLTQMTS